MAKSTSKKVLKKNQKPKVKKLLKSPKLKPRSAQCELLANDLRDLLVGTIRIADNGKTNTIGLDSIYIEKINDELVFKATDGYKYLEGGAYSKGEMPLISISVKQLKPFVKMISRSDFKEIKVKLMLDSDTFSIQFENDTNNSSLFAVIDYPDNKKYFDIADGIFQRKPVSTRTTNINQEYIGDFSLVPTTTETGSVVQPNMNITFTGEEKPIKITIPHWHIYWRGLIVTRKAQELF